MAATSAIFFACSSENITVNLHGEWAFALDAKDVGVSEQWFNRQLQNKIQLPGSLQEQGYGNEVDTETKWTGTIVDSAWFKDLRYEKYRQKGNIKIPFWLQPEKHYIGVAWYQRDITAPEAWKGKRVILELERTHWETTLYINGKEVGSNNSLQTPHRYLIEETGKLRLSIRVDNRMNINAGINAHSVSDQTQSNWNGIIGNIRLTVKPALSIEDVRVFPDVAQRKAVVTVAFAGTSGDGSARLALEVRRNGQRITKTVNKIAASGGTLKFEVDMDRDLRLWSEYEPELYHLNAELISKEGTDTKTVAFGMREIKSVGKRFNVNDTPVFLRGTLECAIFPLTGYPAMNVEYWDKICRQCKAFGLNHIRFHSWCPPEVAFEAADRAGIYLQVECGAWTSVGDGDKVDQWIYEESERIVREYGNHPSFCMLLYGNEPEGKNRTAYLSKFADYWKSKDNRRLYSSGAGWPFIHNGDYWSTPAPRIAAWGAVMQCVINSLNVNTEFDFREIVNSRNTPVVSHETGQWCVYPNLKEIDKYTGVLKAKNFEIFRETLSANNLADLANRFLYASGRLQTLCYKADIEAALRTPQLAGFQLLDLHDFTGQGTALVGVLDAFWDEKGYVTGKEYSAFCGRTVPIARLRKMVYVNSDTLSASLEMAHFDKVPLKNAIVQWEIVNQEKKILCSGETVKDIPIDNCIHVANIACSLSSIAEPSKLRLAVKIKGTEIANGWDLWVYPKELKETSGKPYFTTDYNEATKRAGNGENVLFCIPSRNMLKPEKGGDIEIGFSSIFWNTAWTSNQSPHTLGILCDASHPAFAAFPNEGYSNYQWSEVVHGCAAMVMDRFPADFSPLVYHIDDWFKNRRLGLLFETRVGKGKMMVCSANIAGDLENRPAARQFRHSIEQYMASPKFNPATELDVNLIREMLL
jgi:hypothetical protein